MDVCSNCKIPLDDAKLVVKKCNHQLACDVCFEMFRAVNRVFFVLAQNEFEKDEMRKKRLRLGADYFAE